MIMRRLVPTCHSQHVGRWSSSALVLALGGMVLLALGGPIVAQEGQNRVGAGYCAEGDSEFPDKEDGGDSSDGEYEAHSLLGCATRELEFCTLAGRPSDRLPTSPWGMRGCPASDRAARDVSSARLPLRC